MLTRRSRTNVKPNLAKLSQLGNESRERDSELLSSTNEHCDTRITRRGRLQVKPNIARGSKLGSEPTGNSPVSTGEHDSATCSSNLHRRRRKFTGEEELDTKKMRMIDMVYWNPKKEKGMSHHRADNESIIGEETPTHSRTASTPSKVAAPQVKIGPDGRLVIDEDSLVIAEATSDSIWETIDGDRISRKVTSLSFRNRLWRKGTVWTEKETELFYEILRCTGPDFGLMHEFFPSRARSELKSKFNREERTNWAKLKEVLSKPALLDDDLYDRAADIQKEIEKEALAKQTKKERDKDIKVIYKKRGRKQKKAANTEVNGKVESIEVVIGSSSESSSCEIEGRVNIRSIGIQQNEVVGENGGEAPEVFAGYDDEVGDPTVDEGNHVPSLSRLHEREEHTDQIAINTENQHNLRVTEVPTIHDKAAPDKSQNVVCDQSEDVTSTSGEPALSAGPDLTQTEPTMGVPPSLLIRPRMKRKLVLGSDTKMKSSLVSRETEQLNKDSKISESESRIVNGNDDTGAGQHDKGILTRSSRSKKPQIFPSAAEAGQNINVVSSGGSGGESTARSWFWEFRSSDFDLEDKEVRGRPSELHDDEMKTLL
uniref:Myb_DNA-bind_7 domain-containing protein n=1 Tax=Angiostrongylus cantonensis TaxID=6313 RepID=A0A158P8X0_ANGCA